MTQIHKTLLNDSQRVTSTAKLFGMAFPLRLEPTVFNMAGLLSVDYNGGLWHFYALDNGGFYMAPDLPERFRVVVPNGYGGTLSADAMGIAACLYAYSHLSFGGGDLADVCGEHYHLLREFAMDHAEVRAILAATD